MDRRAKRLWQLFATFFKIGLFTFGGGYAMISLIQEEAVARKHWISDQDILDIVAIAESTPGPIAINSATFVGCQVAGTAGSAAATFGVVLPSFLIILAVSFVLQAFQSLRAVQYAFWGVKAGVLALLLRALWKMYSQAPKEVISYIIMALALVLVAFLKVNVLLVILLCAGLGLASYCYAKRRAEK